MEYSASAPALITAADPSPRRKIADAINADNILNIPTDFVFYDGEETDDVCCDEVKKVLAAMYSQCSEVRYMKLHGFENQQDGLVAVLTWDQSKKPNEANVVRLTTPEGAKAEQACYQKVRPHLGAVAPDTKGTVVSVGAWAGLKFALANAHWLKPESLQAPLFISLRQLVQLTVESYDEPVRDDLLSLENIQSAIYETVLRLSGFSQDTCSHAVNDFFRPLAKSVQHHLTGLSTDSFHVNGPVFEAFCDAVKENGTTVRILFAPIVSLGHGNLHADNVVVDSERMVWMPGFRSSTKQFFLQDVAQLESALLFGCSFCPITLDDVNSASASATQLRDQLGVSLASASAIAAARDGAPGGALTLQQLEQAVGALPEGEQISLQMHFAPEPATAGAYLDDGMAIIDCLVPRPSTAARADSTPLLAGKLNLRDPPREADLAGVLRTPQMRRLWKLLCYIRATVASLFGAADYGPKDGVADADMCSWTYSMPLLEYSLRAVSGNAAGGGASMEAGAARGSVWQRRLALYAAERHAALLTFVLGNVEAVLSPAQLALSAASTAGEDLQPCLQYAPGQAILTCDAVKDQERIGTVTARPQELAEGEAPLPAEQTLLACTDGTEFKCVLQDYHHFPVVVAPLYANGQRVRHYTTEAARTEGGGNQSHYQWKEGTIEQLQLQLLAPQEPRLDKRRYDNLAAALAAYKKENNQPGSPWRGVVVVLEPFDDYQSRSPKNKTEAGPVKSPVQFEGAPDGLFFMLDGGLVLQQPPPPPVVDPTKRVVKPKRGEPETNRDAGLWSRLEFTLLPTITDACLVSSTNREDDVFGPPGFEKVPINMASLDITMLNVSTKRASDVPGPLADVEMLAQTPKQFGVYATPGFNKIVHNLKHAGRKCYLCVKKKGFSITALDVVFDEQKPPKDYFRLEENVNMHNWVPRPKEDEEGEGMDGSVNNPGETVNNPADSLQANTLLPEVPKEGAVQWLYLFLKKSTGKIRYDGTEEAVDVCLRPDELNHKIVPTMRYAPGQRLSLWHAGAWQNAVAGELAPPASGVGLRQRVHLEHAREPEGLLVDLNSVNHAPALLPPALYEAEGVRYARLMYAEQSSVADVVTGQRYKCEAHMTEAVHQYGRDKRDIKSFKSSLASYSYNENRGIERTTSGVSGTMETVAGGLLAELFPASTNREAGFQPLTNVLLHGEPGSGKTTLMKLLALQALGMQKEQQRQAAAALAERAVAIEEAVARGEEPEPALFAPPANLIDGPVPILIPVFELAGLIADGTIHHAGDVLAEYICLKHGDRTNRSRYLRQAVLEGRALVLLDGLDDAVGAIDATCRAVVDQMLGRRELRLVVSTPSTGAPTHMERAGFNTFRSIRVRALETHQQVALLGLRVEQSRVLNALTELKQWQLASADNADDEVCRSPLLLSMLAGVNFKYQEPTKIALFDQVLRGLLGAQPALLDCLSQVAFAVLCRDSPNNRTFTTKELRAHFEALAKVEKQRQAKFKKTESAETTALKLAAAAEAQTAAKTERMEARRLAGDDLAALAAGGMSEEDVAEATELSNKQLEEDAARRHQEREQEQVQKMKDRAEELANKPPDDEALMYCEFDRNAWAAVEKMVVDGALPILQSRVEYHYGIPVDPNVDPDAPPSRRGKKQVPELLPEIKYTFSNLAVQEYLCALWLAQQSAPKIAAKLLPPGKFAIGDQKFHEVVKFLVELYDAKQLRLFANKMFPERTLEVQGHIGLNIAGAFGKLMAANRTVAHLDLRQCVVDSIETHERLADGVRRNNKLLQLTVANFTIPVKEFKGAPPEQKGAPPSSIIKIGEDTKDKYLTTADAVYMGELLKMNQFVKDVTLYKTKLPLKQLQGLSWFDEDGAGTAYMPPPTPTTGRGGRTAGTAGSSRGGFTASPLAGNRAAAASPLGNSPRGGGSPIPGNSPRNTARAGSGAGASPRTGTGNPLASARSTMDSARSKASSGSTTGRPRTGKNGKPEEEQMTELDLSNKPVSFVDVAIIRQLLETNPNVTRCDLRGTRIGPDGGEAVSLLLGKSSLHALGVANVLIPIRDVVTGVVQQLDLTGSNLASISDSLVPQLLNYRLVTLNLCANNITASCADFIADALPFNSTLRTLDLSDNHLYEDGTRIIADALKKNSSITSLNLASNMMSKYCRGGEWLSGSLGVAALSEMLAINQTVETLDLSKNYVGRDGAFLLAEGLWRNRSVRWLNLSLAGTSAWQGVGPDGAAQLVAAIKQARTVTTLNLSNNRIGYKGLCACADLVSGEAGDDIVKTLELRGNFVCERGGQAMGQALQQSKSLELLGFCNTLQSLRDFQTGLLFQVNGAEKCLEAGGMHVLAAAMHPLCSPNLRVLDVRNNQLGEAGAVPLAAAIRICTKLTHVDVSQNQLNAAGGCAILDAMQESTSPFEKVVLTKNNVCGYVIVTPPDPSLPEGQRKEKKKFYPTPEAVAALVGMLRAHPTVNELWIKGNGCKGRMAETTKGICAEQGIELTIEIPKDK
jgi:Ran GTPase-activating protein (RanGAP) involved in mRNA processing and transport